MKIKVGISSCLLGEKVRYDGGHKLDHYLKDTLGQFVDWVTVCPEVECGLSVPREAMRIVKTDESIRLLGVYSKKDYTDLMEKWIEEKINDLKKYDLCGFVFKSRSPSSALYSAKLYNEKGTVIDNVPGFFGKAFVEHFKFIPVEEDGRLNNPWIRENFIERVFIYHRWQEIAKSGLTYGKLIDFHTQVKLSLLSHSPVHYKNLGKLIAEGRKNKDIYELYLSQLMEGIKLRATVKKNTNVLHHIIGYFKKQLDSDDKKELLEVIENYHKGLIPLIVPITLISHYVRKFNIDYLKNQFYLNPYPLELMLRNHA